MQDSPLSITASITGILTFIAAICAFIYVRYNTLRNGGMEIGTIIDSVTATIEESRAIALSGPATQPGDDPDSSRLKKLVSELYSTETDILAQCTIVFGKDLGKLQLGSRPSGSTSTSATWKDVVKEVDDAQKRWQQQQRRRRYGLRVTEKYFRPVIDLVDSYPTGWAITISVLSLGATPTMIRWYRARKKVFEMIQQREIIRSRLLFHQISIANHQIIVANSIARNQEMMVRDLLEENSKLESRLSMLSNIAAHTNQCVERVAHDNDEIKGLILTLINSAYQQDRTQKPDTVHFRSSSGSLNDSDPANQHDRTQKPGTVHSRSSSGSSSD
ncbi:uncharacterized protein BDZ99DRAFT_493666 [Mytilinidion resinicola]|uniref:Uncharacterized protein n=1 Tax=Mytilinidion resinicola TaxID=574789 RepID=A0A6A6Z632_9PEZI|nr:uncharacterized protein BDZ99DRAFT_493666 [Mytilinidion resinicola]KAF2815675.1 hypothetical protein BDZ99DRAFT_493666 [Mytilinidion resinicola]